MRVALYIRVSTDEQAEHGYSIPEQRRELMAHVEREGWSVVDEMVDDGYSGSVGIRPGLDRITRLAEAGEIDVVLAKKRNRLFRDRFIRMGYERSLVEYGVRLVALDDVGHRLADAMLDEFADWYREELLKNTTAGRMQKAREGKLVGSSKPIYGFEYTPDRNAFTVVDHHMQIVSRIMESVAETGSISGTRKQLQEDNVPTLRGTPRWHNSTIRRIVLNDAYRPVSYEDLQPLLTQQACSRLDEVCEYGIVWYPQKRITTQDPDPSRDYARKRKEGKYERDEQVPIPIVSSGIPRDLIDRARAAIRDNVRFRQSGDRVFELSSLIRCGDCGYRLTAGRRRAKGGKTYWYYRCQNNQRNGRERCANNKSLNAGWVERTVLHAVLDAVKNKDALIEKADADFEEKRRELVRLGGADTTTWRRALDGVQRQKANYQRAFASDALSLEDLQARTAELDSEKDHLKRLLSEHEDHANKLEDLEAWHAKTVDLIRRGEWRKLGITDPQARRERYREIGLEASADSNGTIRLSWGLGEERVLGTREPTSKPMRTRTTGKGSWAS